MMASHRTSTTQKGPTHCAGQSPMPFIKKGIHEGSSIYRGGAFLALHPQSPPTTTHAKENACRRWAVTMTVTVTVTVKCIRTPPLFLSFLFPLSVIPHRVSACSPQPDPHTNAGPVLPSRVAPVPLSNQAQHTRLSRPSNFTSKFEMPLPARRRQNEGGR